MSRARPLTERKPDCVEPGQGTEHHPRGLAMLPRTVFVPASAGLAVADLDGAIASATRIGAHVRIAAFAWSPPLPVATPYDMGGFNEPLWSAEVRKTHERVQHHAAAVRRALETAGASGAVDTSLVEHAQLDALVGMHAAFSDIVMVPAGLRDEARRRVVNGGLFLSAAPVVLLGADALDLGRLERVVIGWDGGMEAGAAARAVLPWLRAEMEVELLLVDPVADTGAFGAEPGAQAAEWLARHGASVAVRRLPCEGRSVARVIQQRASDWNADLIAVGGYGHSRLRERVFGGTTRSMVEEGDRPVLLAR